MLDQVHQRDQLRVKVLLFLKYQSVRESCNQLMIKLILIIKKKWAPKLAEKHDVGTSIISDTKKMAAQYRGKPENLIVNAGFNIEIFWKRFLILLFFRKTINLLLSEITLQLNRKWMERIVCAR